MFASVIIPIVMRMPFGKRPATRSSLQTPTTWLAILALLPFSHSINVVPIPSADLDVSDLGRIGIAGDFSGISYYQYEGQSEKPFASNGSESLLTRLPNGIFLNLQNSDAFIQAMCLFKKKLILAGNFTSLGGDQSPAIVSYDSDTLTSTPLPGLQGEVNTLLCDDE